MTVSLGPAGDAALDAIAVVLSAAPVDPPGIDDHRWLSAEPAEVVRRLRRARDQRLERGGRAWVITLGEEPVGYASARIPDEGTSAETFSVLARSSQGQGVGIAARRLVLAELARLGVPRVVSLARAGSASAAISRRLGYELRGTEVRVHPEGYRVELERYELRL